ncbi:MAG: GNAT family N-acetyltransferase [Gemmatimonadaceae bacterium]
MHATDAARAMAPARVAGLVVREAVAGDVDAVVALRLALLREFAGHPVYGRLHPDAEDRAPAMCAEQIASSHDVFLLAVLGGGVVGLLRCTESRASPLLLPEHFAYVSSAYVVPALRRHGVLRALLDAAEHWCAERGLDEMRLHNVSGETAGAAAWASLGFGVVEEVRIRRLRRG